MSGLREIGLSQYEEAVYLAVSKARRADARRISELSKVPPTAVYPNLKSLMQKGLIQKLDGETVNYQALDPGIAFQSLVEKRRQELEGQFQAAVEQARSASRESLEAEGKVEPVSMSIGLETSKSIFADLSDRTKKKMFIMGWKFLSKRDHILMLQKLYRLSQAKKDVRLITNDSDHKKNKTIQQIKKMGVAVRYYDTDNFSIVIRDGEETKITLKNPKLEQRVNLHIEDPNLSAALEEYFLVLWRKAKPI